MDNSQTRQNILLVRRAAMFSPNMQNADAAILEAVGDQLVAQGHDVRFVDETALDLAFFQSQPPFQTVFTMGRNESTLTLLLQIQQATPGLRIVNHPQAVRLCSRHLFSQRLQRFMPPTLIVDLTNPDQLRLATSLQLPCWVKRGEGYAECADDVAFASTSDEILQALRRLQQRGQHVAVVQQHVEGDLVKFYGVTATNYHQWYYACEGHSKFGLEEYNGPHHAYPFAHTLLEAKSQMAASLLGLDVYGGDAIVTPDGEVYLIDLNDWPSFSRFRQEAAREIARII